MSAAPEQLNDSENKEKPKSPERQPTARESGEFLRSEGERMTEETMDSIDDAWGMAEAVGDPVAEQKLEGLRVETQEAKQELAQAIDDVDSGWDVAPTPEPAPAAAAKEVSDADIDALFGTDEAEPAAEKPTEPEEPAELTPEQEEALMEAARMAEDVMNMEDGYFEGLESLAELAAGDKGKRAEIVRVMTERLGKRAAELIDSPELRKEMSEMKERLSGRWGGENGPPITSELTLINLTALRETMGKNPELLLGALDIKGRLEKAGKPGEMSYMDTEAIRIGYPEVDPETGELVTTIEVGFKYDDPSGENMTITREYKRVVEKDKDGNPKVKKSVEHVLFELPSTFKANGLAADITRDSMAQYDAQDVDEVKLHANIDMGGYAWAAYGYGWDKKDMAKDFLKQPRNGETEVTVGGVTKKVKELTPAEKREVMENQTEEMSLKAVTEIVKKGRQFVELASKEAGVDMSEMLAELDALQENALTVTPQTLAELGRKGPQMYRDLEGGKWYSDKTLDDAVANGDIDSAAAAGLKKKPYHAGKVALMNSSWYGSVQLKADGDQGGENRKMLENYLAKSASKKS